MRRRAAAKLQRDDPRGALGDYRAALAIAPPTGEPRAELEREIARLEQLVAQLPPESETETGGRLPGEKERDQERKRILRSFIIVYTVVGVVVLLLAFVIQSQLAYIYKILAQGSSPIPREILAGGGLGLLIGALYAWAFRSTMRAGMIWRIVPATGAAGMAGGRSEAPPMDVAWSRELVDYLVCRADNWRGYRRGDQQPQYRRCHWLDDCVGAERWRAGASWI